MCGIAGEWNRPGPTGGERVRRMIECALHRGPDGVGYRCPQNGPALGHSRLKILDLTDAAAQPLGDDDSQVWVIFNGEIYNYVELRAELVALGHRFRSTGD